MILVILRKFHLLHIITLEGHAAHILNIPDRPLNEEGVVKEGRRLSVPGTRRES